MDSVREWAAAVCCACLIGGIYSYLFPTGSGKRIPRMVISIMILCVLLKPLKAIRDFSVNLGYFSFKAEEYENTVLENEIAETAKDIYSSYIKENLERILDGAGISYLNVNVIMDNSVDGCISIQQAEVIIKKEDEDTKDRIKDLLRPYIGNEPIVTSEH